MDKLTSAQLKVMRYIDKHPTIVLSTIDEYGRPYGTVVYAVSGDFDSRMHIYFLTKNDTTKYRHLSARPAVSLTAFDEDHVSTLQAQGHAAIEHEPRIIDYVMKQLTRTHAHAAEWLPPIAKLRAGNYVLVGVTITHARLAEFEGRSIGAENIFTETN